MGRRERLERKQELREEWAGKARARAEQRFEVAHQIGAQIPMGQPILVGHHSERHARRDIERIDRNMAASVDEAKLAEHHSQRARGIERQLERSIFDDDVDAVERLEQRIAETEAQADRSAAINKAWRKGGVEAVRALAGDKIAEAAARTMEQCRWLKGPLSTTGLRAVARKDRERLEAIKLQRDRTARAALAPGGILVEAMGAWVRVTFAEKPRRAILDALGSAGFRWSGGSWHGPSEKLPAQEVLNGHETSTR